MSGKYISYDVLSAAKVNKAGIGEQRWLGKCLKFKIK